MVVLHFFYKCIIPQNSQKSNGIIRIQNEKSPGGTTVLEGGVFDKNISIQIG